MFNNQAHRFVLLLCVAALACPAGPAIAQEIEHPPLIDDATSLDDSLQQLHWQMAAMQQELNDLRAQRPEFDTAARADWMAAPPVASSTAAIAPAVKYPTLQMNGVFQADAGFFNQGAASRAAFGDIQDGADFRRARLSAKGSVTETVNYMFQMDFATAGPGRPSFTDVWVESTDHPVFGNIRIGQWKQPFSLEVVSSFRYTTFMERSLLFQAFTPFRHLGIGFYDHSDDLNWTWAASAFRSGQDQFGDSISDNGGWGSAERLTCLPWYDETSGGRGYLHLGLGHFLSVPPNNTVNFRTIPELFIGENAPGAIGTSGQALPGAINGTPFFVKTGNLAVNNFNVIGTELLWVHGAFSFQTEAMINYVDQQIGPNAVLPGMYAQAGYFLTGEHRPYDRKAGAIDRVQPFENFFRVGAGDGVCTGWGAWEVAGRVSVLDLNNANIRGGSITDLTAGVNWYWNPYTKLVFNYVHSHVNDPTFGQSDTGIAAMRAQIDF